MGGGDGDKCVKQEIFQNQLGTMAQSRETWETNGWSAHLDLINRPHATFGEIIDPIYKL